MEAAVQSSGLQWIESLSASDFSQDDPTWPIRYGCLQKILNGDDRKAIPFTPSCKVNDILFLCRVLNRDALFMGRNPVGQDVDQNRIVDARALL
jgi:hypothetical protein